MPRLAQEPFREFRLVLRNLVHPGNFDRHQPVELRIDSFHATRLKGHVDSLSPASIFSIGMLIEPRSEISSQTKPTGNRKPNVAKKIRRQTLDAEKLLW